MSRVPKPLVAGDKIQFQTSRGGQGTGKFVRRKSGNTGDWYVIEEKDGHCLTLRMSQVQRR